MTPSEALNCPEVQKIVNSAKEKISLNSLELLSLFLYTESEIQDSDFREYFEMLPETYSCPVTWDMEEIKKLPLIVSQQLLSIKGKVIKYIF